MSSIYTTLKKLNRPCVFSHFHDVENNSPQEIEPPFVAYFGSGQNQMRADSTIYWRENIYEVQYYFAEKDEAAETAFEDLLLSDGWLFDKSEDVFVDDLGLFYIYYNVTMGVNQNGR